LIAAAILQAGIVGLAPPAHARETALSGYEPGTIVVRTSQRRLYLVLGNGQTLSYPVGVGKSGKTWTGMSYISGKFLRPAWSPPAEVRMEKPYLPDVIPGGSSENPMGAAAMTLSGGGEYAIHGTNRPSSIGGFVSFGCIRMHNRDVMDLYQRVQVGTPVVVLR
jgi:lipoprotein-anchoring transpeptidase ErfK/SrfK